MANQIIIDIGAVANDGTGDPLRTAFNYVNNNFSNIWTTGVANSNISFSGNRILTTNVNGNLVLAPNGIGKVQANVDIIPNANNTLSLGSLTRQWNTVYAQNLAVNGNVNFNNLTVDGNLTVVGNTIQIGNIVTDTKTIQLANTASTANAANGSGITVGANDNIATLLYSSSDNLWVTNIGLNVNGNLLLDNGASIRNTGTDLLRVNSPANGVARLQGINADGSSLGATFAADGTTSQARITAQDVANSVVKTWIFDNSGTFTNPGNIVVTSGYGILGTGTSPAPFLSGFGNLNAQQSYIVRGTFSGDPVTGDASLYVGSPTFTNLGTDVMAQFTGNVTNYAQLNLQNYGNSNTSSGDYIITADNGTDSTHFLNLGLTGSNWNGTQPNSLGNRLGPNDGYLYVQDGDMVIGTSNGNIETWKFGQDGTLTVAGDIVPTANNTQTLGTNTNRWSNLYLSGNTIYLGDLSLSAGADGLTSTAGFDLGNSVATDITANVLSANTVNIGTGAIGIGDDNYLVVETLVPGGLRPSNDDTYNLGNVSHRWAEVHANVYYGDGSQLTGLNLTSISNDGSIVDIVVPNGDVTITANSTQTWAFGTDGTLTAPGNVIFADDYVYSGNTFTSPETNGTLKNFKWEFSDLSYGADTVTLQWNLLDTTFPQWYLTTNSQGNTYVFDGDAKTMGFLDNSINSGTVTFGTAANNGAGGSNDIELTTVTGNAYVRTGSNSWKFGNTGVLTAPGNISATGNVSGAYILGNGSQLTSLPAPTVTQDITSNGAMSIMTYDGNIKYNNYATVEPSSGNISGGNILTGGLVSATGNITGGNIITAGNVSGNTAGYTIGYRDIPQVSFTGNATIATTDAGKHFYSTQSTNYTLTIANNASQGFQVGAAITVVNQGTGTITVAQGTDVTLYMAGNATSGNRSVATFGMATIMKVATNTWFINGTGVS